MASYDDTWRERINNISYGKKYPLARWFPDGGNFTTFDFKREPVEANSEVNDVLFDLGYSVTDYLGGYATNNTGRTLKIGKILNKKILELKKLEPTYETEEDKQDLRALIQELEEALRTFNNDQKEYLKANQTFKL